MLGKETYLFLENTSKRWHEHQNKALKNVLGSGIMTK